jgi:DNA replicative helicase MCM subunit Mcm2 (Cdc46/Mcm family)
MIANSDDYYGHDPRIIDVGVKEDIAGLVRQGEPVNYRGRLQFVEKEGKKFLIIPRNHRLGGSFLESAIIVKNSSLVFLSSTNEGFENVFETRKQKGFLSAYQIMETPGGQSSKVLVVNVEEGGFTSKTQSTLLIYDW